MAPRILPDGSCPPSFMGVRSIGQKQQTGASAFRDTNLHEGEVIDIFYPGDSRNRNGKVIEYHVRANYSDGNGQSLPTDYQNCIMANMFGSFADYLTFTLRPAKTDRVGTEELLSEDSLRKGSRVLLLCVNGYNRDPIIIGAVPDLQTDQSNLQALGHHLEFNFNGINATITDEGALKIQFNGATENNGTLVDASQEEKTGSYLQISANGSIDISTGANKSQFIKIDHENKKILIYGNSEFNVEVSEGPAKIVASEGLKVGQATDKMIKGTTYINAEKQAIGALKNALQSCGQNLLAAVTAAPSLAAAGGALLGVVGALDSFVSQLEGSLSEKNELD